MKKIALHIIMVLFTTQLAAQYFTYGYPKHEVLVGAGFGHSGLHSKNPAFHFGGNLNLSYALSFNQHFAIVSGLQFSFYTGRLSSSGFLDTILFYNPAYAQWGDERMLYIAEVHGIRETQRATYLYIPLMARGQIPFRSNALYAMGGLKFGIPITGSYRGHIDKIRTTGYSFYDNQPSWYNLPEFGFSTFENSKLRGKFDLGVSVALSLELGYIHTFSYGKNAAYFGIFTDFGLNNILRNPNPHTVNHNPDDLEIPKLSSYTGRFGSLRPNAFGIMVRFRL